jgi:hypothetical protein
MGKASGAVVTFGGQLVAPAPPQTLSTGRKSQEAKMDRKQKIEKTARDRNVSKISNLIAHAKHLSPDYILETCDGILSETGQLK